jgi:hypothetical protein
MMMVFMLMQEAQKRKEDKKTKEKEEYEKKGLLGVYEVFHLTVLFEDFMHCSGLATVEFYPMLLHVTGKGAEANDAKVSPKGQGQSRPVRMRAMWDRRVTFVSVRFRKQTKNNGESV